MLSVDFYTQDTYLQSIDISETCYAFLIDAGLGKLPVSEKVVATDPLGSGETVTAKVVVLTTDVKDALHQRIIFLRSVKPQTALDAVATDLMWFLYLLHDPTVRYLSY